MPTTLEERVAYLEGKVKGLRKGVCNISLSPLKSADMTKEVK
ncbi:hypothetical protein JZK55_21520 [Dissulfurispira thermophila]|uniref:Uncharacterized protein n=2 Tax=root TaxID=1 RepID=A0A7G1H349_9BACT|nr:hypothetical protein [Dissulfurispira thermophila]BCB97226.1 hypothetical protein JZK55_21480 [Dissulfurispira thermophila]BCB97230.1 hypothetical protein JZK55_21520 [Dissulfurispira thermophila]